MLGASISTCTRGTSAPIDHAAAHRAEIDAQITAIR